MNIGRKLRRQYKRRQQKEREAKTLRRLFFWLTIVLLYSALVTITAAHFRSKADQRQHGADGQKLEHRANAKLRGD